MQRLDCLFRSMVKELQSWSAKKIGNIKEQLLMAREVILRLDREQENRPLSQAEAGMQASLKRRCLGLSSLERTMARQRARI